MSTQPTLFYLNGVSEAPTLLLNVGSSKHRNATARVSLIYH